MGTWRVWEFDVTAVAKPGEVNVLAVEITPQMQGELGMTFVDWNPLPPDKNMGLWRDVHISATGPVSVRFPNVVTKLNLPKNDQARLTVTAELTNATKNAVEGVLKGRIENVEFSQPVKLNANETRVVRFEPDKYKQLQIANPRLWWPVQTGPQNLYPLQVSF